MNLRILFEFSIFFHCVCTVFPPNLRHPTSKLLKMEKSPTEAVVFTSSCVRKNRWGWVKLPIAILLPYLGEYTSIIIHHSSINQLWLRVPSGSGFDPYIWTKVKASVGRWWYSKDSASGSYPQTNGNRNRDQFFNVTDGHLQWYNTVRRLLILTSWLSLSWTGFHPTPITKSLSLHKVRIKSL